MELAHRRRTGLGERGEPAHEVVASLIQSGFTHVMLCPPISDNTIEFDPTLGRLLAPWTAGRQPLYRDELSDAEGVARRYAIYELSNEPILSIEHAADRVSSRSDGETAR